MAATSISPAASSGSTCFAAGGSLQRLSPTENPELFDATIAGIGLTGIITAVCIRLVPAPSPFLLQHVPQAGIRVTP
jgi:FAD/FMN-containing dehydrogenase